MSLRISAPLSAGDTRRGRGMVQEDAYMSRLVKLVPAEAVTIYPMMMQQAKAITPPDGGPQFALYFSAWVMLIIVVVLRWKATSGPGQGAQWGAVLISAVAFVIWVHVLDGGFGFEQLLPDSMSSGGGGVTRGALPDGTTAPHTAVAGATKEIKQYVSNTALIAWTMLAPVVYRGEDHA